MKILSIGAFSTYGISNTCLHRHWALEKIGQTDMVDITCPPNLMSRIFSFLFRRCNVPVNYPYYEVNKKVLRQIEQNHYDLIWIDKGVQLSPRTLRRIKEIQKGAIIVGYSPDNMVVRHNQSPYFINSIKYYDYYVTTKSYTVDDLYKMGVPHVLFVNNAFESTFHHPYVLDEVEKKRLGGKIGFIGAWEKERFEYILYLAEHGVSVRVWGGGRWLKYQNMNPNLQIEPCGLFTEDYNKALSAFDISLCFLRKINFDLQTTRTMEIPACGSMLMAERTKEHLQLFEEDKEAVFFSSKQELLEKCQYYLNHPKLIKNISNAGLMRCKTSGYSNVDTIKRVLEVITKKQNL